jgi:hypothetical protein
MTLEDDAKAEVAEHGRWEDDGIQFPRLIAEMEACGAFTPRVLDDLCESMDLDTGDIAELVDRAQTAWETIKSTL